MSAMSTYLQNKVNDHVLGGGDYSRPATVYFALFTAAPTKAGGGTEVSSSGTAYARVAVTNNDTNFPASSSGTKATGAAVTFPTATGNWGSITSFGIFDQASGGNLLYFGNLQAARTVATADTARFAAGDLAVTYS